MLGTPKMKTSRTFVAANSRLLQVAIVSLFALVILLFVRIHVSNAKPESVISDLDIAFATILTFLLTSIFFEVYIKKNFEENIDKAIAISLNRNLDPYLSSIQKLSGDEKGAFLRNVILRIGGSLVGDFAGQLLWNGLISAYIQKKSGFRTAFEYSIEIDDCHDKCDLAASLIKINPEIDMRKFHRENWLCRQQIYYLKEDGIVSQDGHILAIFGLEISDLHSYMTRGDVYFREVLTLSDQLKGFLDTASEESLDAWVRDGWRFQAECRGGSLKYSVKRIEEGDKVVICIAIDPGLSHDPQQAITLSFSIPHAKTEPYYRVILPEPTERPVIDFRLRPDGMWAREFVFFGSSEEPIINRNPTIAAPDHIKVTGNGWTFPTSGVLFVWGNKEGSAA